MQSTYESSRNLSRLTVQVTIPTTALLAIFLFGIEELGIQIEEPFGILPLEALCDTSIEGVVMDMQDSYQQGFFGELRDGQTAGSSPAAPDLAREQDSQRGIVRSIRSFVGRS